MTGAEVYALGPEAGGLTVAIDPGPPAPATAEMEARWASLAAQNPRLFDGRILAFLEADAGAGRISARVERYKRMATQTIDDAAMTQLGVTGIVTAPGADGARRVLLGRRSADTHVYPGRWELAPSGGVDAPRPGVSTLSIADIRGQLERELIEETGVDAAGLLMVPIALCRDPGAPSMDVVFRIDLDALPARHATWEFDELVWFEIDRLDEALEAHGVVPTDPSGALLRWMGWLSPA